MSQASNLIYGARSGLQKAIRRGDIDLAATCFELLWNSQEHRHWMLWRMPVWVFEDCWIMAGELAKAQEADRLTSTETAKKLNWFKFIMRLTTAMKNQDAAWLWNIVVNDKVEYTHPEIVAMIEIRDTVGQATPDKIPAIVFDKIYKKWSSHELTEYETMACRALDGRRTSGGMVSDRWNALSAQLLIHMRGIKEEDIQNMLQAQKQKYAGRKIHYLNGLPWYCYDMHTRVGKLALRVWLKNYKTKIIDEEWKLCCIWFKLESALLGKDVLPDFSYPANNPTWRDTIWSDDRDKALAKAMGTDVETWRRHWKEIRENVKKLVLWAQTKA